MESRYRGSSEIYGNPDPAPDETIYNPVDEVTVNDETRDACIGGLSNVNLVCHPDKSLGMDARSVWTNSATQPPKTLHEQPRITMKYFHKAPSNSTPPELFISGSSQMIIVTLR